MDYTGTETEVRHDTVILINVICSRSQVNACPVPHLDLETPLNVAMNFTGLFLV